jgi:hypothetical protein
VGPARWCDLSPKPQSTPLLLQVVILADLAERARFAEAAVVLAMLPHSTPNGNQGKWIALAEAIWPESTRDVKRYPKRTIAFGWFYLANLLAARDAIAGREAYPGRD